MTEANDPTRSGPPVPTADVTELLLSKNEIVALGTKAARGAGMEWGLAEEAGFAAGWLSVNGMDGARALLAHLERAQGRNWPQICPAVAWGEWRSTGDGPLCPVALGATLCDFAGLTDGLNADAPLLAGPVSQPVLLLPFLATIARQAGGPVSMEWGEGQILVGPGRELAGQPTVLAELAEASLNLSIAPEPQEWSPPAIPIPTHRGTMAALTALAMRTTVPASAASRDGAGAGDTDND